MNFVSQCLHSQLADSGRPACKLPVNTRRDSTSSVEAGNWSLALLTPSLQMTADGVVTLEGFVWLFTRENDALQSHNLCAQKRWWSVGECHGEWQLKGHSCLHRAAGSGEAPNACTCTCQPGRLPQRGPWEQGIIAPGTAKPEELRHRQQQE